MSELNTIISKQLKSYPIFKRQARIAYFSKSPLMQVHIDTMFWQASGGEIGAKKIPILVIVDVATRYTCFFVQTKKSESIPQFLEIFIKAVKSKWKKCSKKMLLITDGARELKVNQEIDKVQVKSKISKGLNKAVLAEVAIRKARAILRDYELKLNLRNLQEGKNDHIDSSNIKEIFKLVEEQINLKAKIRKLKPPKPYEKSPFNIGDPVFALNLYKYAPYAVGATLQKQGYMQNWYYEPFYISKQYLINGVYKYSLASYVDNQELKYNFYPDQLQLINPEHAAAYIKNWLRNGVKIVEKEEDEKKTKK